MYIIKKDPQHLGHFDMYQNAIHVNKGWPYYVTKLTLPSVYNTMEEAGAARDELVRVCPDVYEIMDAVDYIKVVEEKMIGYERPLWKEWFDGIRI